MAQYVARICDELEGAIIQVGADRVAAFICEPVVGSSLGVVAAEPGYLQRIREICDRHEILLLADEVMCGSGRTGDYFAFEHDGVRPDIVTLGKGISGGYQALAATVISGRVSRVLNDSGFAHGHTYVGHAAACAAGCAVQEALDAEGLLERTGLMGGRFGELLREKFGEHPRVGDIRGRGLFWALELVSDRSTKRGFDNGGQIPGQLMREALKAGLICYPGGISLDGATVPHILLAPPMIVEESHMLQCVDRLGKTLRNTLHD